MTNNSEIFKAAHRQAKRMKYVGGPAYAVRFAEALRMIYAAHKQYNLLSVGKSYQARNCHTLTANQRSF